MTKTDSKIILDNIESFEFLTPFCGCVHCISHTALTMASRYAVKILMKGIDHDEDGALCCNAILFVDADDEPLFMIEKGDLFMMAKTKGKEDEFVLGAVPAEDARGYARAYLKQVLGSSYKAVKDKKLRKKAMESTIDKFMEKCSKPIDTHELFGVDIPLDDIDLDSVKELIDLLGKLVDEEEDE